MGKSRNSILKEQFMKIKELFLKHPRSVGEGYFEHLFCALRFGFKFMLVGVICLIHAVLPFLFQNTATRIGSEIISCNEKRKGNE